MEQRLRLEELPDVLTIEELAAVLRLSRGSTYEAVRQRRIPSVRVGRRLLVPKAGVLRLLEEADGGLERTGGEKRRGL